jgi:succinoglycan biosynthesis transport protein ExoP
MAFEDLRSATDLRTYLAIPWRRKFLILPFIVLLPLVAYKQAASGTSMYEASATVLLNRQSLSLSGLGDPNIYQPDRMINTQAQVARMPAIAQRVVKAARVPNLDPGGFLANSSVGSNSMGDDLMTFRARNHTPAIAVELANLYARKYIEFRREIDTQALASASTGLEKQIDELKRQGLETSALYSTLVEKQQQIATAQGVQASNALIIRTADGAGQVAPRPNRTTMLALGLGLILGLGLAFLVDTLDTRIRSVDRLAAALGLPLLAAIPRPTRRNRHSVVMLHEPNSAAAELFRILRTTLDMTMPADCRTILVTSALEAEGKSTTAANLAAAMARAGRHVILVGLDLGRPSLERWFDLPAGPGVTDVAFGKVQLEDALKQVPLAPRSRRPLRLIPGRGVVRDWVGPLPQNGGGNSGVLEVLMAGSQQVSPHEFTATREFDVMLERMRHRADIVIVDGPPLLLSSEARTLTSKLDSVLVIARLNALKEEQISELNRILLFCPATKLGLVVTGATQRSRSYYRYREHDLGRQRQPVE